MLAYYCIASGAEKKLNLKGLYVLLLQDGDEFNVDDAGPAFLWIALTSHL